MNVSLKILIGFILLFSLYHAAEYMIMFENNIPGFFLFQFLFFFSAWLISKWQSGKGFLSLGTRIFIQFRKDFNCGNIDGAFALWLFLVG